MGRQATRASDERLLRMLEARARGDTLTAIARREKVSFGYVSRELDKVRQDDLAHARDEPRSAVDDAYRQAKGAGR